MNPENQIDMYHAAAAFLARHLGGRDGVRDAAADAVGAGSAR